TLPVGRMELVAGLVHPVPTVRHRRTARRLGFRRRGATITYAIINRHPPTNLLQCSAAGMAAEGAMVAGRELGDGTRPATAVHRRSTNTVLHHPHEGRQPSGAPPPTCATHSRCPSQPPSAPPDTVISPIAVEVELVTPIVSPITVEAKLTAVENPPTGSASSGNPNRPSCR
ncbi:hypothetical protein ACLOJK_024116, partial [Asimina triloba]